MDWAREKETWPNAAHSRFIRCRPHDWHVQVAGRGDTLLLLHGAGGATQSWRALFPILAQSHHVVAPDLPGQGFTRLGTRLRLAPAPLAEDIVALCAAEGWRPTAIVGHSAGGVLALELAERLGSPQVIGLNAALGQFEGAAGWLFPLMAKMMALNPLIPPLLARMAGGESRARELLESTGSKIDPLGIALYRRLMADKAHIDGTLAMMAQWDIRPILARLETMKTHVVLMAGEADGTVPAEVSRRAAERIPNSRYLGFPALGHLMHEDAANDVAVAITAALAGQEARAAS
ncbi:MAG: alpha/beta fold hydrolase BchO [Pseudomonadota bacterium]